MAWKMALSVLIAAASRTSMKMTTNRSGMAELMNSGMMVSTLPLAASMDILPNVIEEINIGQAGRRYILFRW